MVYNQLIKTEFLEVPRKAIAAMLQDPLVMRAWEHTFSDADVDAWMDRHMAAYAVYERFGYWAVVLQKTGRVIGQCGITLQDGGVFGQVPEVGYMLASGYWHKGYALEAARAARDYGFQTVGFPAMYSIIREGNEPSMRLAIRNGMRPVGNVTKWYRGREMLHIVYEIGREHWSRIEKEREE